MSLEFKLIDVQGIAGRIASFFLSKTFSSLKDSCYCIMGLNPCLQPLSVDPNEDSSAGRPTAAGKFDSFTYEMTGTLDKSDILFTLSKW